MFEKVFNWPFLQEPAYRWAMFVGLMLLIFFMWRVVIGHMKAAA
jgi:hypothetical protein